FDLMYAVSAWAFDNASGLHTITASGRVYRNAGADAVSELTYTFATAVQYLREMEARGATLEDAASQLRIELAVGNQFFMEIAKLRAARLLWSKLASAAGNQDLPTPPIHAFSDNYGRTVLDPHVNMLRATNESLAAVVGQADYISIASFDALWAEPDEFSRRTARNTQLVLKEECDLLATIDPAGGSWYIEWLTDQVARSAWELFQSIEESGGMSSAILEGSVQVRTKSRAAERTKRMERRRDVLVGTNSYANPDDRVPERKFAPESNPAPTTAPCNMSFADAAKVAADGATLHDILALLSDGKAIAATPLEPSRAAAPFESFRAACQRVADRDGQAPALLQANLGPSRFYRGRADWTSSFFRVGGFRVIDDIDFDSDGAVLEKASEVQPVAIVLTGTDDTYAERVTDLAKSLSVKLPNATLLVAGTATGEQEIAWRDAGIDGFVNIRSNIFETLQDLLRRHGVLQ
ncbi:MAG: hypothetical protein KC561_18635, partial [Myxococcales bacterium]|nr:hypothetical protein [Myxococcales bacterium]